MSLLQDKTPIHSPNTYHTEHASISFQTHEQESAYQQSPPNAKEARTCKVIPKLSEIQLVV